MTDDAALFEEYWCGFVRAHVAPSLRRLSFIAMSAGLGSLAAFLVTRRPLLLIGAPIMAFGPPWVARKIAGNVPPPGSKNPIFFAAASIKMWHLILTGAMDAEVERVVAEDFSAGRSEGDERWPRPNMVTDHTLH